MGVVLFFKFENCINFKSRIWVVYAELDGLVRDASGRFFCFIADNGFYGFDIVVLEPIYRRIRDDIMMHIVI